MEIKDKRFSILGMARSGLAAAHKLKYLGAKVFISEFKPADAVENSRETGQQFDSEFGGHTERVLQADTIIVSPGIPGDIPILKQAQAAGIEIISEIELGFRLKHKNSRIICCTGSNGKSTTVSLIHHILISSGYKSILAGNIGVPFTSFPIEEPGIDFIVLELSSFQLELIKDFRADVAMILNITPDHLDRYKSFRDYAETKFNIFRNQTKSDLAVLNFDDELIKELSWEIKAEINWFSAASRTDGWIDKDFLIIGDHSIQTDKMSIKGPHNQLNVLASILSTKKWIKNWHQLPEVLRTFSPLPHRLQLVGMIDGVTYVNDSKATNTDAVKYALLSYQSGIHLILGGSDKGEDFSVLVPFLQKDNVKVYLTGATRPRMVEAFKNKITYSCYSDLSEAVKAASRAAISGEVVLLSPACASYDAYKNYKHRGNCFKQIVDELNVAKNHQ